LFAQSSADSRHQEAPLVDTRDAASQSGRTLKIGSLYEGLEPSPPYAGAVSATF
jgi:hypothetical protein